MHRRSLSKKARNAAPRGKKPLFRDFFLCYLSLANLQMLPEGSSSVAVGKAFLFCQSETQKQTKPKQKRNETEKNKQGSERGEAGLSCKRTPCLYKCRSVGPGRTAWASHALGAHHRGNCKARLCGLRPERGHSRRSPWSSHKKPCQGKVEATKRPISRAWDGEGDGVQAPGTGV